MDQKETARIIAMVASVDHRVPPLARGGPDERVPAWQVVLGDMDYPTVQQAVVELARDPGMVAIRPGDVYQAARRVMRRHLASVNLDAIDPPDDMGTMHALAWRRALVRAVGRGAGPEAASAEADAVTGATRRAIEGRKPRDMRGLLTQAAPADTPATDRPDPDAIRAELDSISTASEARGLNDRP